MTTEEMVRERLQTVMDPELGRSVVELQMVDRIEVVGERVRVGIKLTVSHCPLQARLKDDVTRALHALPGVRDVEVELGVMTREERESLAKRLRGRPEAGRSGLTRPDSPVRVVIVASGKGGVGKSTVTVNLAAAMQSLGQRVGVMDADIYGFSVPRMLGLSGNPTVLGEGIILPMDSSGVRVISMGSFVGEDTPVIWRGPMLAKALEQFLEDVAWGDIGYLLIDSPPGTGDVALSLSQRLPRARILLVTTPQAASARVAGRVAQMAGRTGQRLLGVVENMAFYECPDCGHRAEIFGEGGAEELARSAGTQVIARLPLQPDVSKHSDAGTPVVWAQPLSPTARRFRDLADVVVGSTAWQDEAVVQAAP